MKYAVEMGRGHNTHICVRTYTQTYIKMKCVLDLDRVSDNWNTVVFYLSECNTSEVNKSRYRNRTMFL
jgi:hypothetical protein